ncbi:hypothetical protein DM806_24995 [Sphingobium lactosutens]|nr:hypothetical protein [Sphingobium lactosutens]
MSMPRWQPPPPTSRPKAGGVKKTPRTSEPSKRKIVSQPYGFFDDIVNFVAIVRDDELTFRSIPANTGRPA